MSRITDFRLLSFDVYGTLIDWEQGILTALEPLISRATAAPTREVVLESYDELERQQQVETPEMLYQELLTTVHPKLAAKLNLPTPTEKESEDFGACISKWPAFPDTVGALRRLQKTYKLVVLSNVDRQSFAGTNAGSLEGFNFDGILTAQDIGSYKPDPRNFEHMLKFAKSEFGIDKGQVLQTAQSQFHDHKPAKKLDIHSVWIDRVGAAMGLSGQEIYDWKFGTLGEMADAVEEALEHASHPS